VSGMADKERRALEIIALAASISKNCVLFFSGGKDSAAVLSLLQKAYPKDKISLVFMPFVEGLAETELVTKIAKSLGYEINLYRHWRYFVDKAQGSYCHPKENQNRCPTYTPKSAPILAGTFRFSTGPKEATECGGGLSPERARKTGAYTRLSTNGRNTMSCPISAKTGLIT
jgi:asparagine synthetase B (glutamine-hydrolysing)